MMHNMCKYLLASSNRIKIATPASRSGQAMLEFAVICLVLTGIMAAILGLGLMLFQGMAQQSAAESAARLLNEKLSEDEVNLSMAELNAILKNPLDPRFAPNGLYDEAKLILSGTQWANRDALPVLNRLLLTVYIYDVERSVYRYPGTVVHFNDGTNEYDTVLVPLLDASKTSIESWLQPVLVTNSGVAGRVSINYPAQSAALIEYRLNDEDLWEPVEVIDGMATAPLPTNYTLAPGITSAGGSAHQGEYGLGELFAYSTRVRPFRKVLTIESAFVVRESIP